MAILVVASVAAALVPFGGVGAVASLSSFRVAHCGTLDTGLSQGMSYTPHFGARRC
jgi:hypothetical protein